MAENQFQRPISPLNAWSYAYGCILGWGAFVLPLTVFLPQAGLWGALQGFGVGTLCFIVLVLNVYDLSLRSAGSGRLFELLLENRGRPFAFAAAWMLSFAYLRVIALNARAFVQLIHALLCEYVGFAAILQRFGLTVKLIDLALILVLLTPFIRLNLRDIRCSAKLQTVLALTLAAGIAALVVMVLCTGADLGAKLAEAPRPDADPLRAFARAFMLIPCAFAGFDSAATLSREGGFSKSRLAAVMIGAIVMGAFGYMATIVVAALGANGVESVGQPAQGLAAISVAASARALLGPSVAAIALIALLAAILTGINAGIVGLSRLYSGMVRVESQFVVLGKTNAQGAPAAAVNTAVFAALLLALVWNDFLSMERAAAACAAFAYGGCALTAMSAARKRRATGFAFAGAIGVLICAVWLVLLAIPAIAGASEDWRFWAGIAMWIFVGIACYSVTCRGGKGKTL